MRYHGTCHCGNVAFDVEGDIKEAMACNCSMCVRKGSLLWFVPRTQFQLRTTDDAMSAYTFNKHVIKHRFCNTCGIHGFAEAIGPSGTPMVAINIRVLEGVDHSVVPVKHFDGRSR
jgi:hypothetical protein